MAASHPSRGSSSRSSSSSRGRGGAYRRKGGDDDDDEEGFEEVARAPFPAVGSDRDDGDGNASDGEDGVFIAAAKRKGKSGGFQSFGTCLHSTPHVTPTNHPARAPLD